MSKLDLTEQHTRERAGFAARVPISISRDDTRDHADTQRMTGDALFHGCSFSGRTNMRNAMTDKEDWVDIGSAEELARTPLRSCDARTIAIAISFKDEQFGAASIVCNR